MNEENTVMNGEKPRKKKHSLWWLWFLLILAAFACGTVVGLKINTLPLPMEVRDRLYPMLESYIPGSTTPRTADAAAVTPEPTAAPVETPAPEETPAPVETPAPAETPAPVEAVPAPAEETPASTETPAPMEAETAEPLRISDTAAFEAAAEPEKKYIGVGAALETALNHAQIAEADAEVTGVYRTKDADGEAVYEVGFQANGIAYEYVIGAYDGEIAGWKMSGFTFSDTAAFAADFSGNDLPEAAVSPAPKMIGEDRAKELSLLDAAVKPAEVLRAVVELQNGPHGDFYKVTFRTASRQFAYEVDAYTGEILASEVTR